MLKRSQTRPRARLARSLSSHRTTNSHAFILLGALLLLASVVFLQLKLGNLGASFRRDRPFSKEAGQGRSPQPRAAFVDDPSLRIKPETRLDDTEFRDSSAIVSGSKEERVALEARGRQNEDGVSSREGADVEGGDKVDNNDEDDDEEEDDDVDNADAEKVEDSEMDMELEAEESDDLDNGEETTANGGDGTEDKEVAGKDQLLSQGSKTEALKASKDDQAPLKNGAQLSNNQILSIGSQDSSKEHILDQEDDRLPLNQQLGITNKKEADNSTVSTKKVETGRTFTSLEGIKSIARWDWQEMQPEKPQAAQNADSDKLQTSAEEKSRPRRASKEIEAVIWDHLLGVARTASTKGLPRKFGMDTTSKNGSSPGSAGGNKQDFGSDDMPVNEDIRQRLEEVATVEDALLLKGDKQSVRNGFWAFWGDNTVKKSSKRDSSRKEKLGKASLDPLYPFNNPLLQDPDTYGPSSLTKSDKAILKALRKDIVIENPEQHMTRQEGSSGSRLADAHKSQGLQAHPVEFLSGVKTEETANILNGSEQGRIAMVSGREEVFQNESSVDILDKQGHVGKLSQNRGRRLNEVLSIEDLLLETGFHISERELQSQENDSKNCLLHTLHEYNLMDHKTVNEQNVVKISPELMLASDNNDILQRTAALERSENEIKDALNKCCKSRTLNLVLVPEVEDFLPNRTLNSLATSQLELDSMESSSHEDSVPQQDADFSSLVQPHSISPSSHDRRKWGFFPGLDPFLSFSDFLEKFLDDQHCALRVFMAWTTPPWSYTIRHQRGLESIFYVHPDACVVVFSEAIELDFFKTFVADGYRVAVVMPNLEELLRSTPAYIFASVWLNWRKTPLYYLHYTELLRLAALYKYGGVYLDSDVIVLKPLNYFRNTVGLESLTNNKQALNGAVMAFNKSSPFLMACLNEFTATYDDQLIDWNGAGLLKRVLNITSLKKGRLVHYFQWDLKIEPPFSFFPISSKDIVRYFTAPDDHEQQEQELLFQMILVRSHTVHFWNRLTASLVPEAGSLMERIINYHCLRCKDYI